MCTHLCNIPTFKIMSVPLFPEVAIVSHISFTGKIAAFICLPLNRCYEGEDGQRLKQLFPNISGAWYVHLPACLPACLLHPPTPCSHSHCWPPTVRKRARIYLTHNCSPKPSGEPSPSDTKNVFDNSVSQALYRMLCRSNLAC